MEKKSNLTVKEKLTWGLGGFTENLGVNVIPSLAFNIFQIGMGISPVIVSTALSASRVVEAVTDPLIGNFSDNTNSRWGRRRPWIFVGAIIMSLVFISVWFTPREVSDFGLFGMTIKGSVLQATYLIATFSLFFMTFAIWQIPYSALGLEFEENYIARTRLQTYKVVFSYIIGTVIGSLYLITTMKDIWGGDEITGARYMAIIIGIIMIITGIIPAILCRERYKVTSTVKVKFWPSLMETFKDRPFRLLMGAIFFVFFSLFFMLPLLGYINMYHVCYDGMQNILQWSWREPFNFSSQQQFTTHKGLAGLLGASAAVIQTSTQIGTVILLNRISKYFDKITILMGGLIVAILGYVSSWWLFTPDHVYYSIFPPIIINIGLCACWVLIGSFSADICDFDEYKTGKRREGMFSAVTGFLIKGSIALVGILTGAVLVFIGIDGANPILSVEKLSTLRVMYIVIPVATLIFAILFMFRYPLTKAKVFEIQEKLRVKRAES